MLGPGRRELAQLRRYLTIEHGPAEVEQIVLAFEESLHAMADGGFLPPSSNRRRTVKDVSVTPVAAQPPERQGDLPRVDLLVREEDDPVGDRQPCGPSARQRLRLATRRADARRFVEADHAALNR